MAEDAFTARQVATLIEDLRGEFRAVAEVALSLRQDMLEVKERLTAVETRLTHVEDAIRVSIPDIFRRLTALEAKAG